MSDEPITILLTIIVAWPWMLAEYLSLTYQNTDASPVAFLFIIPWLGFLGRLTKHEGLEFFYWRWCIGSLILYVIFLLTIIF